MQMCALQLYCMQLVCHCAINGWQGHTTQMLLQSLELQRAFQSVNLHHCLHTGSEGVSMLQMLSLGSYA